MTGSVLVRNNQFQYWYSGYGSSYRWQIGYATSPFTPVDVPEPRQERPTDFSLLRAYPNPFNPETTIEYEIPNATHVRIKVFDALGKEVATLVDGEIGTGKHAVKWNSENVASGVYWYRLTAGSFTDVKRVTVVK